MDTAPTTAELQAQIEKLKKIIEAKAPTPSIDASIKSKGAVPSLVGLGKVDELFTKIGKGASVLKATGGALIDVLDEIGGYGKGKYDPLQASFGGLADIFKITNETSAKVVQGVDGIYDAYFANNDMHKQFLVEREGQTINAAEAFFKNEKELTDTYLAVREDLAQKQSLKLNQMTKSENVRMSMFSKGLRISTRELSEVMERQIALTGEASNKTLFEVAAHAGSISAATGVSYQEISGQIVDIITDVERFGNVQVEEAGRIAGALNELGLSYQGFGGMVDKFMNFDTAAASLGNLTTVFGVHFDAMEMMMLANEDQEEFLHRMREAFIDSGKAVEDMTLAEKRLASQQMGMSITDFENFMQEDRILSDLTGASEEAKAKDAGATFQEMTDQMVIDSKTLKERADYMKQKVFDSLSHEAYRTGNAFEAMKSELYMEPAKFLPGYNEYFHTVQESTRALMGSATLPSGQQLDQYSDHYRTMLHDFLEANRKSLDPESIEAISEIAAKEHIDFIDLSNLTIKYPDIGTDFMEMAGVAVGKGSEIGYEIGQEISAGIVLDDDLVRGTIEESLGKLTGGEEGGGLDSPAFGKSPSPGIGIPIMMGIIAAFSEITTYPGNKAAIQGGFNDLSKVALEAYEKAFADEDNPLINALGSPKKVDVAVTSSGAIADIVTELQETRKKSEEHRSTTKTQDEEHKKALTVTLETISKALTALSDKEVVTNIQTVLDTNVIANKLIKWRGAGGSKYFKIEPS